MKRIHILVWALAAFCSNLHGQTNPAPPLRSLFLLPHLQLRPLPCELALPARLASAPQKPEPASPETLQADRAALAAPSVREPSPASRDMTSGVDTAPVTAYERLDIYRQLEAGGFLRRPEAPSPFEERVDKLFRPEVVRLGKTTVCCSLLTAIKRKNPLCLLNPIFLGVSW